MLGRRGRTPLGEAPSQIERLPAAPAARPQPPGLSMPGGAGRLGPALVGRSPGWAARGCGPTPGAGTNGSSVAWGGRTRSVAKAV
jgi:hypothetical protein